MNILSLATAFFLFLSTAVYAADNTADKPHNNSADYNPIAIIESINTMTADFTQINTIKNFGDDVYAGRLTIMSGQIALWDYTEPFVSWYIFSKDSITQYDGVNNQLIIYEGDQSTSNVLLQILLDIKSAKDNFNITHQNDTIYLEPKEDLGIKDISLKLTDGVISEMKSSDNAGNTSRIIFKNVSINIPLNEEMFLKEAPKDAEVFRHK